MVTGTTATGHGRAVDQLDGDGQVVKADACRQAIGERSTATAGKGGRPTTRDGPESTELGPAIVSTALKHSFGACARSWPSADSAGTSLTVGVERQRTGAGVARLGVETTRPAVSRSKNTLIPSYDGRHGLWGPKELGRPSARSRASADAILLWYTTSWGGRG